MRCLNRVSRLFSTNIAGNHYRVLGVSKTATRDEIRRAYISLAKEHHPDTPTGNEEKFKRVAAAWEILGNEKLKRDYDSGKPEGFKNEKHSAYSNAWTDTRNHEHYDYTDPFSGQKTHDYYNKRRTDSEDAYFRELHKRFTRMRREKEYSEEKMGRTEIVTLTSFIAGILLLFYVVTASSRPRELPKREYRRHPPNIGEQFNNSRYRG